MTFCRWFVVPALLLSIVGCAREVAGSACTSDVDCKSTEVCDDDTNTCMAADAAGRGCTLDIDCDVSAGEVCLDGACQAGGAPAGTTCTATADCPMDQFCNSATSACQPLLEGWCREASQCGASAPVCSSQSPATPGRCVECMSNDDCPSGESCKQPGVCEDDGAVVDPGPGPGPDPEPNPDPEPLECGANAHASGTRCVCDSGFIDDGAGGCAEDTGTTEPESDVCAEYGWYDDGVCDDFCLNPDPDCTSTGPDPEPSAECAEPEDCWATNIDNTCEGGQCVCDIAWMESFTCNSDEIVDPASCSCQPGTTTSGVAENESCVTASGSTLECATGLECIYATDSAGDPSYGSCKQTCTASSQCGTGRTCALGFLTNGDGICGTPKTRDQTGCTFWDQGDTFCFDPNAPTGSDDAMLECLNSTCEFMCDYDGNTSGAYQCPSGSTCGQPQPMSGFDVDVAQCQ
jgi:hypothetical protein